MVKRYELKECAEIHVTESGAVVLVVGDTSVTVAPSSANWDHTKITGCLIEEPVDFLTALADMKETGALYISREEYYYRFAAGELQCCIHDSPWVRSGAHFNSLMEAKWVKQ